MKRSWRKADGICLVPTVVIEKAYGIVFVDIMFLWWTYEIQL